MGTSLWGVGLTIGILVVVLVAMTVVFVMVKRRLAARLRSFL